MIIFFISFFIAYYKDREDNKSSSYLLSPNFDIKQYYILKFKKDDLDKKISFCGLYIYLIWVNYIY